ncbi:hypothetical protein PHYPSEUDO_002121 [Phytophthora pseudosyringae]|uniref:Uncharacterized protein n=1 Tax=Phytophthora pseudosyringae TaxID=221518 RepID=A0A8T1VYD4_9STRA|nr:hypothetical protein PHYPSEUDO_002121 [Phytophthora pseudosyringae]
MEPASALLELVRDAAGGAQSSHLSECALLDRLESVKKQLRLSAISSESSAIAACHVTAQVLAFLVQHGPVPAQRASSKWHKRVLLLETTVASASMSIASSGDADWGPESDDRGDLCSLHKRLLQRLWETPQTPQEDTNAVAVVTKLCVLLAICWLCYDRVGNLTKAEELLTLCGDFCLAHESTKKLAKWPLFLLGLVRLVEKQDYDRALGCFRGAVERCGHSEGEEGVLFYWYAVALIRKGDSDGAVSALETCIRVNYEPAACVSLQALLSLQAMDFHAAAEQLQRALEIDVEQSRSMFNYALLMKRMDNFEAQQLLLECIVESHGNGDNGQAADKKRKHPGDDNGPSISAKVSTALFGDGDLASLLPSRLSSVNMSIVHLQLAVAAMESGSWLVSKQHFEAFFGVGDPRKTPNAVLEAARDYVYVLLQCKLPSLALRKCEQYLLKYEASNTANEDNVMVAMLLLHLYKADALLCLERVGECCEYLQRTVQPKIQGIVQEAGANVADAASVEIVSCHTQLLNNIAVVVACCAGVDTAISLLQEGLQLYPDCLAIKFNLVLLLWRKDDKTTAVALWMKTRGWDLRSNIKESKRTSGDTSALDIATTYHNAAVSASTSQAPPILEHVQGILDGEGGVSAQQLVYLDALIMNFWRKMRNSQLVDTSLQYVKYLESLGITDTPLDG